MERIAVSNRFLDENALNSILERIESNSGEKILILTNCGLTRDEIILINESLKKNNSIESIQFQNNFYDAPNRFSDCCSELAKLIKENNCLKYLNLSNVGLDAQSIDELLPSLIKNKNLHSVNLSRNDIGDNSAIANLIENTTNIKELILNKCKIGDRGLIEISRALKFNKSLYSLSLSDNQFSEIGMNELSRALKDNTNLARLDLNMMDSNIKTDRLKNSGKELALALQENSSLTFLDLRSTGILWGPQGKTLAKSLRSCRNLRTIDLRDSYYVSQTSLKELQESLTNIFNPKFIISGFDQKEIEVANILKKSVQMNKNIFELYYNSPTISRSWEERFTSNPQAYGHNTRFTLFLPKGFGKSSAARINLDTQRGVLRDILITEKGDLHDILYLAAKKELQTDSILMNIVRDIYGRVLAPSIATSPEEYALFDEKLKLLKKKIYNKTLDNLNAHKKNAPPFDTLLYNFNLNLVDFCNIYLSYFYEIYDISLKEGNKF